MSMKGIIVRLTGGHHSNLCRYDADNAKIGQCSTYQTTRERKILPQNQYNSFTALTDGHKYTFCKQLPNGGFNCVATQVEV